MKSIILCFVTSIFINNCLAQNSFPNLTSNPIWRINVWIPNDTPHNRLWNFTFTKDTLINNKIYQVVTYVDRFKQPLYDLGYIRTENAKVFVRRKRHFLNTITPERLLYDFAMKKGDSTYCSGDYYNYRNDSMLFKVKSVDTVIVAGVRRKRMEMEYMVNGIGDPLSIMYWIEGIGSTSHPFYAFACLNGACEEMEDLACYENAGVLLYYDSWFSDCAPLTATNDFENIDIKVFPTLAIDKITIESHYDKDLQLQISNAIGQVFVKGKVNNERKEVDVSLLSNGIYFITLSDNKRIKTFKFVKN